MHLTVQTIPCGDDDWWLLLLFVSTAKGTESQEENTPSGHTACWWWSQAVWLWTLASRCSKIPVLSYFSTSLVPLLPFLHHCLLYQAFYFYHVLILSSSFQTPQFKCSSKILKSSLSLDFQIFPFYSTFSWSMRRRLTSCNNHVVNGKEHPLLHNWIVKG